MLGVLTTTTLFSLSAHRFLTEKKLFKHYSKLKSIALLLSYVCTIHIIKHKIKNTIRVTMLVL